MDSFNKLLNNDGFKDLMNSMMSGNNYKEMQDMMQESVTMMQKAKDNPNADLSEIATSDIGKKATTLLTNALGEEKFEKVTNKMKNIVTNTDKLHKIQDEFLSVSQDSLTENGQINYQKMMAGLGGLADIFNEVFDVEQKIDKDKYFDFDDKLSNMDDGNPMCILCHENFEKTDLCCMCDKNHIIHKECYFEYLSHNSTSETGDISENMVKCIYCTNKMCKTSFLHG